MSRNSNQRKAARSRLRAAHIRGADSHYRRTLRYEPLEDRRLLAVVTVNTLGDTVNFNDRLTSLREAIFATNLVAGADEIQFAPSLTSAGPANILLTQGELKITDSLTITGPGAELLTIDAAEQSRIFNVPKSISTDVVLSGLTLTRGRSLENGGAIVAVGHGLQLTNMFIANSTAKDGGAIAVMAGTLQVQGSTFTGNRAPNNSGGAIYAVGPTTIIDSNFVDNTSRTGGAIAAHDNLELNQTTVDHNTAVFGGGIWIGPNGHLFANGAVVRRNVSLDGLGGGIGGEGPITIVSSQILNNISSGDGGGGIGTRNHVTVEGSLISGNKASSSGGGISISGALIVRASTISGNGAGTTNGSSATGGGIYLGLGTGTPQATIESSTIFGNFAEGAGGGIGTRSGNRFINVLGSTISGNTARSGGSESGGRITLRHSTVTDNSAIFIRGDLGIIGGIGASVVTLDHTIVAGNREGRSAAPDLSGRPVTARFSLIGDSKGTRLVEAPVGLPNANGNLIGGPIHGEIAPLLGPLADNGGFELPDGSRILTHALLPGSPAINAGDLNAQAGVNGVPLIDQRGTPFGRVVNGRIDIGAFEYQSASDLNLLVDTLLDESDGNYSRHNLSLREAIALANIWPSTDTIRFDPTLGAGNPVPDPTLVSGRILLTQGELKITDDVSIIGLGAELLTIDASGNDPTPNVKEGKGSRVLLLGDDSAAFFDIAIAGLAITGGDVDGHGGGIHSNYHVSVSLNDLIVHNNAASHSGGGLFLVNSDSEISVVAQLTDVVFESNEASDKGGGIYLQTSGVATTTMKRIVVSNNSAMGSGGGIYMISGGQAGNAEIRISDSRFADNRSSRQGGGVFAQSNFHGQILISSSEFADNSSDGAGGGIYVLGVNSGSLFSLHDSRIEGNTSQVSGGGVFVHCVSVTTVEFSDSIFMENFAQVDGGGIYVLHRDVSRLAQPIVTSLNRLEIVNNSTHGNGGGIAFLGSGGGGIFELHKSAIADNSADSGGGIHIQNSLRYTHLAVSGDRITISENLISGNIADRDGGGLYGLTSIVPVGNLASLTLSQNTISGNLSLQGGGIYLNDTSSGNLQEQTIDHNTITFNISTGVGGGIFLSRGLLGLSHTIVAGNSALLGRDLTGLLGAVINLKYSLIGSNANSGLAEAPVGTPDANGNLIGTSSVPINPQLGPLADNGGPTETHALLAGSPAIDAGDPAAVAGVGTVPEFDQRGAPFTRVSGGRIDIGAFESQPNPLTGDYNFNAIVDSGDYAVWRDTRGSATDLRADGNGDGAVNDADRLVWMANFGNTMRAGSTELGAGSGVGNELRVEGQVGDSLWRKSRARVAAADPRLLDSSRPLVATAMLSLDGAVVFGALAEPVAHDGPPVSTSTHGPAGRVTLSNASLTLLPKADARSNAELIAARRDDALLAWASRGQGQERGRADFDANARADYDARLGDGQECPSYEYASGNSAAVLDCLFASWSPKSPANRLANLRNFVAHLIRG